jgi:hypothetical protein
MAIKVSNADIVVLDLLANEANDLNANGFQHSDSSVYANTVVPVAGYTTVIAPGSSDEQSVKDGMKSIVAPLYRRVAPIVLSQEIPNASLSYTIIPTVSANFVSLAFPDILHVARDAIMTLSFSSYATQAATVPGIYLQVNGINTSVKYFYFNTANQHTSITMQWKVSLPVIAIPYVVKAYILGAGVGNVVLDTNDTASLTVLG